LRVTRRRRDGCTADGGRVGHTRRCGRDDGYARGRCRHSSRVRLPAHVLGVWQFVVLFPLHAPVLEPDFDLTLRQTEAVSDLDAASSSQVAVEMELFFQFENLMTGVGRALPFGFHAGCESSTSSVIHYSVNTDNI